MTRRQTIALAALLAAPAQAQTEKAGQNRMYDELLKASMETKKGLMFYVKGQTIAGVVTRIADGYVEARSQQYSRIMIRMDSVDAVAMA
jgi:hypothetical protein